MKKTLYIKKEDLFEIYSFCVFTNAMKKYESSKIIFHENRFFLNFKGEDLSIESPLLQENFSFFPRSLSEVRQILFSNIEKIPEKFLGFEFNEDFKLFKYVSNESVSLDCYLHGYVVFAAPKTMNDIFDSNCLIKTLNGNLLNGRTDTRALCLSKDDDSELLWAFYANESKGYCFEYSFNDLKSNLQKNFRYFQHCLIVYGDVDYYSNSLFPKLNLNGLCALRYKKIENQVEALFCKHNCWSFENEYRFILVQDVKSIFKDDYITIEIPHMKIRYKTYSGSNQIIFED